ncbi:histidine phosphatase family protein [Shewanella saliphila]|uniref:Histidine phosphatase family protein n=1 Tax=Shewanella saliphila TaxID=2282698 RepID=A0ABQ2Q945_9GAMM|nr:histidine phosphatase family protein [Shewanella saliphila]MCL1100857.1 histidine phosphatase family protein [Shewanella saliphila]GGP60636.1 histidine phosphatase family protein [Shewanella saliphila]
MAKIYLIRHGQASFGSSDYDQLSDKGSQQASILGQYWRSRPLPSKYYCGDLLRHGQTLSHFAKGLQTDATPMVIHSGFNEFNHVDILQKFNGEWHHFSEKTEQLQQYEHPNKVLHKEFYQALNRWMSGKHDLEYKESWPQFKSRCIRALQDIIEQELASRRALNSNKPDVKGNAKQAKDILVFTSGGTISAILQHMLQLNDKQTLAINQQTRNTSVTKILFSEKMLSVDYFNNYSHLEQAGEEWITFR